MKKNKLENIVQLRSTEIRNANNKLKDLVKKLEKESITDQLTGAFNRGFLDKAIAKKISSMKRSSEKEGALKQLSIGFIIADLDYFKTVNDTYGHAAGDTVLKEFVQCLNNTCRESDWVIRWGGEEFVIVSECENERDTDILAERVMRDTERLKVKIDKGRFINITCSIGIAHLPSTSIHANNLSLEDVLSVADIALYKAKSLGRNRWVRFNNLNFEDVTQFYSHIQNDLEQAIENNSIELLNGVGVVDSNKSQS